MMRPNWEWQYIRRVCWRSVYHNNLRAALQLYPGCDGKDQSDVLLPCERDVTRLSCASFGWEIRNWRDQLVGRECHCRWHVLPECDMSTDAGPQRGRTLLLSPLLHKRVFRREVWRLLRQNSSISEAGQRCQPSPRDDCYGAAKLRRVGKAESARR
ncbi:hypothetical protein EJ04DRAFT_96957 [Polyplosphaeria fusca]|uniref:Uncharacterized protein n=1 Tax=Polyplosphaeria fusca TaxID=682080 RepID=A0A9P4UX17_9PLEO|nr:hypothetical protein EJ04DRAFT_96957 [Polyplosphaeria fusca]